MERFWAKVNKTADCWLWTASLDSRGYGQFSLDGRNRLAHRVSYRLAKGPMPAGRELDHLCRNPRCVNPDHLEPVTHAVNMARSAPAQKTSCVNGHAFTPGNTYRRPNGQRDCRACIRARVTAYQLRNGRNR